MDPAEHLVHLGVAEAIVAPEVVAVFAAVVAAPAVLVGAVSSWTPYCLLVQLFLGHPTLLDGRTTEPIQPQTRAA